jgi:NAD(P) transhydrogenase subunit beta
MHTSILFICYLIGSVSFIIGLKMLSNPATARKGNLVSAAGMAIAILGTLFLYQPAGTHFHNYGWIVGAMDNYWFNGSTQSKNDGDARNGEHI